MLETDVCIVGAGPAGLMASIYAAHRKSNTAIVESSSTPGLKLLRTGGGRCNITHVGTADEFIRIYGDKGRFLRYCTHEFSPDKTIEFFEKNDLQIVPDETGCCYPITNRATDVKRILIDTAENLAVKFVFNSKIENIDRQKNTFILQAPKEIIVAKAIIIATGGISWPQTGSNGDGYQFAKQLGHTIIEPKASLVPLVTQEKWVYKLSGVSMEKVAIRATLADKKLTTVGPLLFTDNGIGGPAVLDFSRYFTDYFTRTECTPKKIALDLVPDMDFKQLDEHIAELCQRNGKKEIPGILSEFLPRSLAINLADQLDYLKRVLSGHLLKQNRQKLVKFIKEMPLTIVSTRSIKEATVTRGGVSTAEIDDQTMQSKICPGLFFAGEVIDVDGPCGGFNLQIGWSTGVVAGSCAAEYTKYIK